jgi:hypothetical protein
VSLVPLQFPPGVYRQGTRYQAKGRWYDASLVRFLEGSVRPIGGWQALSSTLTDTAVPLAKDTFTGSEAMQSHTPDLPGTGYYNINTAVPSGAYQDLTGLGYVIAHGGTSPGYCISTAKAPSTELDGVEWYADVTLVARQVGGPARIGIVFRSTVLWSGQGQQAAELLCLMLSYLGTGDDFTLRAQRQAGGSLVENTTFGTGFTLAVGGQIRIGCSMAGAVMTGWTEPFGGGTRTTLGTYTFGAAYADTDHEYFGMSVQGQAGYTTFTVHELAGQYVAQTPLATTVRALLAWKNNVGNAAHLAVGTNENLYDFTQGALTDVTPMDLTAGAVDTETVIGPYGSGAYGAYNYGEGDPAQGSEVECAVWSLDTWGEDLVACLTSDGRLHYRDTSAGGLASPIVAATGSVPTACKALVVTPERFLFALGAGGDPRLVQWPSQETLDEWDPAVVGATAGDFPLPGEGILMCGLRGRNETLLFTDKDLFAAQYIGGTLVYSFKQVGSACGVISRHGATFVSGKAVWMGQRSFFLYDGFVQPIPCEISDAIFGDFNRTQRHKCFAVPMALYGEVWFFYPSAASQEPDRYAIWNYVENHWTPGVLTRTAAVDRGAFGYPMFASESTLYEQERGSTRSGAGAPYLESGPIEVGVGDRLLALRQLIPDEATQAGQVLGSLRAYLYSALYPTADETTNGPYTLANPTDLRVGARQIRLRVEELVAGDWRLGTVRVEGVPMGRR